MGMPVGKGAWLSDVLGSDWATAVAWPVLGGAGGWAVDQTHVAWSLGVACPRRE